VRIKNGGRNASVLLFTDPRREHSFVRPWRHRLGFAHDRGNDVREEWPVMPNSSHFSRVRRHHQLVQKSGNLYFSGESQVGSARFVMKVVAAICILIGISGLVHAKDFSRTVSSG
jgi:hypothetical protein